MAVMAGCECLETCPFFKDKMLNMPAMSEIMKQRYCRGDWSGCARYRVYKVVGNDGVPEDLFPNQIEDADRYLSSIQA